MSATPTIPPANYQYLKFFFNVDFVKPNNDVQEEIRDAMQTWSPPTIPEAITITGTTGWCKWDTDRISSCPPNNHQTTPGVRFQECSLFYNSETSHFLGVPFDCRAESVEQIVRTKDARYGWRRVMFNHIEADNRNRWPISVMKFDAEHNVLAAPGSVKWIPQLVPESYNYNQVNVSTTRTALAGSLALIIAFAALSGPAPENQAEVIRPFKAIESFKPPEWESHTWNGKKVHGRGVIVSIRCFPGHEAVLSSYQDGSRGPLILP
ncbi:hypothetical protein FQN53_001538 [Emmonsiellopsis sp. PD_33]|nr:hypothetical protein FQN53_001538 [Emmonsiellopsis sp. PD_33]